MVRDGKVWAKKFEYIIFELFCVVWDDDLWNPKSANDVFSNKILGIPFSDFGEGFRFHPFREVVYGDDQ